MLYEPCESGLEDAWIQCLEVRVELKEWLLTGHILIIELGDIASSVLNNQLYVSSRLTSGCHMSSLES